MKCILELVSARRARGEAVSVSSRFLYEYPGLRSAIHLLNNQSGRLACTKDSASAMRRASRLALVLAPIATRFAVRQPLPGRAPTDRRKQPKAVATGEPC